MYYELNRGQPDASTFEYVRLVQALKHAKQFIHVLHIKAYSIVPDNYDEIALVSLGASDLDFVLGMGAREFNRVGKKVNQYKP
jgi:hypothetical protein